MARKYPYFYYLSSLKLCKRKNRREYKKLYD